MFGLGLSLRIADFTYVLRQPKAILIGISAQIIALPLIAFLLAILFKLPPELAMGLMIISFVPGGTTSNMFTNLAKGDVALSISLTAIASLITPFTIPLFSLLAMRYFLGSESVVEIPLMKIIIQLLAIIILPVILGMFMLLKVAKNSRKSRADDTCLFRHFSVFYCLGDHSKKQGRNVWIFYTDRSSDFNPQCACTGAGVWLGKTFSTFCKNRRYRSVMKWVSKTEHWP